MLYVINTGIPQSYSGIDVLYFKNIPFLAECGVLHIKKGKPAVDIPILKKEEYNELSAIAQNVKDEFIHSMLPLLSKHLKNAKAKLPPHLKSVPEQKQYLDAMNCLHMFMVFRAMEEKSVLSDIHYPCLPMVLIVEK